MSHKRTRTFVMKDAWSHVKVMFIVTIPSVNHLPSLRRAATDPLPYLGCIPRCVPIPKMCIFVCVYLGVYTWVCIPKVCIPGCVSILKVCILGCVYLCVYS